MLEVSEGVAITRTYMYYVLTNADLSLIPRPLPRFQCYTSPPFLHITLKSWEWSGDEALLISESKTVANNYGHSIQGLVDKGKVIAHVGGSLVSHFSKK